MKALRIDRYATLDELAAGEVSESPPADGEVRIEIEAAGVNPSDVGIALGRFPTVTLPRVLGRDFAGRVVDGPAELVGAAVWGSGGGELGITRDGAHAEYLTLPAGAVARRPAHLSADGAAAMGVPFVTAWSALVDLAAIRSGEWVLVAGATGAVGTAAVQLARALGARVVALVRDGSDTGALEGLGVAAIARLESDDVPEVVRTATGGAMANVALNGVGATAFAPLMASLAHGGRMVVYSIAAGREVALDLFPFYRGAHALLGLDSAKLELADVARILGDLAPLVETGAIEPPRIAERYPLSRAREAYEAVAAGAGGKVVIVPDRLFDGAGSGILTV